MVTGKPCGGLRAVGRGCRAGGRAGSGSGGLGRRPTLVIPVPLASVLYRSRGPLLVTLGPVRMAEQMSDGESSTPALTVDGTGIWWPASGAGGGHNHLQVTPRVEAPKQSAFFARRRRAGVATPPSVVRPGADLEPEPELDGTGAIPYDGVGLSQWAGDDGTSDDEATTAAASQENAKKAQAKAERLVCYCTVP